jgi:hypothetical protein
MIGESNVSSFIPKSSKVNRRVHSGKCNSLRAVGAQIT